MKKNLGSHVSRLLPFVALAAALSFQACVSVDDLILKGRYDEAAAEIEKLPETQRGAAYSGLGRAYFDKKDYDRAYDYFTKAGDAAGLDRLAAEFFTAKDYDRFIRCWQEARKRTVLREEFLDNARGWNVNKDTYMDAEIRNGVLAADKPEGKSTSFIWTNADLDPSRDFRIETIIRKKSGPDNQIIGAVWGLKDVKNNSFFGVSGDGEYVYGGFENNVWTPVIGWTVAPEINQGDASNKLEIVKSGDVLFFSINDRPVGQAAFKGFAGDKAGIVLGSSLGMEAEYFHVEEYPPARAPWSQIGEAALNSSDFPTAIKYYALAGDSEKLEATARTCFDLGNVDSALGALEALGLSEKAARMRLASMYHASGKEDEAVAELDKAGWNIRNGFSSTVAREGFNEDSRGWWTGKDDDCAAEMKDGAYVVEKRTEGGRFNTWNTYEISLDADFEIQAVMKKRSGPDDGEYSIIWGFEKTPNCQSFGVTGSGSFSYGYFDNGDWKDVIATTPSPSVRKGNSSNTLTIRRIGDETLFLVNGAYVGRAPYRKPLGSNVGFALFQKMSVEIDGFSVVEYAPQFVLDLAKTKVFADQPEEFARLAVQLSMDRKDYKAALDMYLALGDRKNAEVCNQRLGEEAAAQNEPENALGYFLKAGETREALQGLLSAYRTLGQEANALKAQARLGDWLFANGMPDDAFALYKELKDPALLDAAGKRYFDAGDYASASLLFKGSGNTKQLKESYRMEAARLVKEGNLEKAAELYESAGDAAGLKSVQNRLADRFFSDKAYQSALDLYRKAGNTAKAAEIEKIIKAFAAMPGAWGGQGVSFTVSPDGNSIQNITLTLSHGDGTQDSMSSRGQCAIANGRFECSTDYPVFKVRGVFLTKTSMKVVVNGKVEFAASFKD